MLFQGNAIYAMIGIIVGAVLNIGLDPLLIFVFDMGIAGAGIATLISQICSFIILLYMDRKGENIRIRLGNFTPSFSLLKEIVYGGSPSLCRQGLASTATILLNVAAGKYGDAAIAGMSIVTRICMFINSFVIGFGQGFQPVCGFNYGAGFYTRVRQGFWFCIKLGVLFLTLCAVIGYIYAPEIVSWFRKEDAQVIAIGARALRWQLITLPLGTWVILFNMLLQTIRKPVRAVILSSARQGLFFIPFILIQPLLAAITMTAYTLGIIPPITNIAPWTMPTGLGAFFNTNGSVAALLLALFNLAVSTLVYLPFVVISNKAQGVIEQEESEEDIANALKF